jgi:hypothetical protein
MKRSIARIERFVQTWEERLAPPPERTSIFRLMADPGPGETPESAISKHLEAHPEDRERADWLAWLWTRVPRYDKPNGDSPVVTGSNEPVEKPAAPPAAVANATTEKPPTSPAPEPKKPALKPEPEQEPPITPWGFGPRKTYNALTDDYE